MGGRRKTVKRLATRRRRIDLTLDESVKQFFPRTSRMGVGIATPWEKQVTVKRKKDEDKPTRLRLPRVAFSRPL